MMIEMGEGTAMGPNDSVARDTWPPAFAGVVPTDLPTEPPPGWQIVTDTSPPRDQDVDILCCTAQLAVIDDNDERDPAQVVGWTVFVGRRSPGSWPDFDEPEHMSSKPSASWLMDDWEWADRPSYWAPLPAAPPASSPASSHADQQD